MIEFVPITRYSRCKRYSGATIKCPECHTLATIYHLSWSALTCQNCKTMIDKYDWFIEKGKHSKKELRDEKTWCIYSHLTDKEKTTVDEIVSTCLERNGFAPEDNWWEMNYILPSEDLNDS